MTPIIDLVILIKVKDLKRVTGISKKCIEVIISDQRLVQDYQKDHFDKNCNFPLY